MNSKDNNIVDDIEIIEDENMNNEEVEVLEPTPGIGNVSPLVNQEDKNLVTDNLDETVNNQNIIESILPVNQDSIFTLNDNLSNNNSVEVSASENASINNSSTEVSTIDNSNDNNFTNQVLEPLKKEKKKNKFLKPILIILVILFIIGGGLFAYKEIFLLNKKSIIQNGVVYMFNILDNSLDKIKSNTLSFDTSNDSIGMDGTITMSSNYKKDGIDLTKLKDYSITYNSAFDFKNGKMSMNTSLNKNDSSLLSVASYISEKLGLIESNQLSLYTYRYNLNTDIKDFKFNTNNFDDYKRIINKTRDITKNFIDENDISKDSVSTTINGKKSNYTRFTYSLNAQKYLYTILKEYSNDENTLNSIARLVGLDSSMVKESFISLTDEYDEAKNIENKLSFEIYVDSIFGTFKQLVIYNPKNLDEKFTLYQIDNGYKFELKSFNNSIFGEYIGKRLNIYNDNLKISYEEINNNQSMLSIDYKDNDYHINIIADMKSNINDEKKNDKYEFSFLFEYNGSSIDFKINIDNNMYKNATVKEIVPFFTKSIDEVDQYEIQNIENKFMEIMDNIIKDIYPSYNTFNPYNNYSYSDNYSDYSNFNL